MNECRERPLEGRIEASAELDGSSDPMIFWIKGHVDKAEFAREVNKEYELDYTVEEVNHTYVRLVPVGAGRRDMYMLPAKPGRGAFPVTQIDADAVGARRARRP